MVQGTTKVNRLLNTILSKRNGIPVIGISSAVICFLLSYFGYFSAIDSQIYTGITKISSWQGEKAKVLSVDVEHQQIKNLDGKYWQNIIEKLDEAGAEYVVFTFPVVFNDLSQELRDKVLVGLPRKILNDKELHLVIKNNTSDWAIADPWPYGSEVQRTRPQTTPVDNNSLYAFDKRNHQVSLQTIDSVISKKLDREQVFNQNKTFDINFIESDHRIAQMNLREMTHASSIPEVVKGKVIVFGPSLSGFSPGVSTPLTGVTKAISQAHFWGIVTDTIYNEKPVTQLSYFSLAFLILLFSFCGLFLRELVSCRWNFTFMVLLSSLQVFASWQLLQSSSFWLPVHLFVSVQWLSFILYSNFCERRNELIIKDISFEMKTYLKSMHENERSYFKSEFWQKKVEMISMSTGIEKIKIVSCKNRIKSIINHKIPEKLFVADTVDKRSQLYKSLKASRSLFLIPQKSLIEKNDSVYWYSLGTDQATYGALIFILEHPIESNQIYRFEQLLKSATNNLLVPLHHLQNSNTNSTLSFNSQSSLEYRPEILETNFRFLGQKIQALNEYSNRISNPTAFFNTLGELKQNNDAMVALMKQAKINITDININTLISKISGLNIQACQDIYQGLLVDNNSMVVPSVLILHPSWRKDHKESVSFDLKLSPTYNRGEKSFEISGGSKVSGILLELVNTAERPQAVMAENKESSLSVESVESGSYDPIRLDMLLTLMFMEFENELAEKEITYEIKDSLDFEVLLAITELKHLIIEAFKVIIEDAHAASVLEVSCDVVGDRIDLNFQSSGFGLVESPELVVAKEKLKSGSYYNLNLVMQNAKKSGITSNWINEPNKGISLKLSFNNLSLTKAKAS